VGIPGTGTDADHAAGAGPGRDPSDRARLGQLADEQAALRRVATLVASGAQPAEVFSAVADELGRLIGAEATFVSRVDLSSADWPGASAADPSRERAEPEGDMTVLGSYGRVSGEVPVGYRAKLDPGMMTTVALRTGRPARMNGERLATGPFGAIVGRLGMRAAVATPIVVEGHYWGVAVAATSREDFPPGTESRMAEFMELAATAIANAESRARVTRLAEEQAALRRVATLVARGAVPEELFAAVTEEAGRLLGAHLAGMARYESDHTVTVLATWAAEGEQHPLVPGPWPLEGGDLASTVFQTGRPVRIDDYHGVPGRIAAFVREELGISSSVASPIVVEGRLWGVLFLHSKQTRQPLPRDTESRLAGFTELVATAIANTQTEQKLRELADTQAALRRLATLVARGEPPEAVFAAATREALRHFGSGTARMIRYELDGTATLVANEGTTGPHVRVGERWEGYPPTGLTATVLRTSQAARVDDYRDIPGGEPYLAEGLRSAVAMPIHVHGRLWGLIAVGSGQGPLRPDTEQRMTQFTDLVATAVANAQNRAELMTSRARIVAASDEARRRIERDLHDGAQQRLVTLALRLRMAAEPSTERGEPRTEMADAAAELMGVIDDLREISRGIHPAILSEAGLRPALRALGRRSVVPVELDVRVNDRLSEPVEVGAYYVVSEMLANAEKHARASVVEVGAETSGGTLRVRVRDDGIGGADPVRGSGLLGLKDRIEALGGTFSVHSPVGRGTTVTCELPVTAGGGYLDTHRAE
jgi:signal transduction histidine kinase